MSLLGRRIRGFRLVDLLALVVLVGLILGVYLAKTIAGRERAEIATAEKEIAGEKTRIRLLDAEVAHLEQPARIERLSETYLGMEPLPIKREAGPDDLAEIALHPAPPPKTPAAPSPQGAAR
ncbi:MAG TPA: cell division protein [Phenylobacterium sp.]|jgi:cell division protein FtsL|nr:cell division protein [Phenylobacterium sp.]